MQLDDFISRLREAATPAAVGVAIAVAALFIGVIVGWRVFRRRKPPALPIAPDLSIDVNQLGDAAPPGGPPLLACYHLPVRLAAVVLAPAGRAGRLPADLGLDALFDAIVPGLSRVVALHRPAIHRWPEQLSASGFAHRFFAHAPLPGRRGKGTPWCAVAGVVRYEDQSAMVGFVLRAAAANTLSQIALEHESQWLDVLRVKE